VSNLPANVLPQGHPGHASGNSPEDLRAKEATLRAAQLKRERSARDAALGRRVKSVERGDLGPVLRRWVAGSVLPVSERLRGCFEGGDPAVLLGSPVFGVPADLGVGGSRLDAVREWFLKGGGEDLTLAVLGTAISRLAVEGHPVPLTSLLTACGMAARETAIGQFITQVQGAKAMMRVRTSGKASWKQGKQLNAVAAMLGGQAREALRTLEETTDEPVELGAKKVLHVMAYRGEGTQQITLRAPSAADWDLLEVARWEKGSADTHRAVWMSFSMLVLCAAQAEAGWFELVEIDPQRSMQRGPRKAYRRKARGLVLSAPAYSAIKGDLDKWLGMGFTYEPMLVEPVSGDYLSVKHREVAGGRGPMGVKTRAEDSAAWHVASETLAKTRWVVAEDTLRAISESPFIAELAAKSVPDEVRREAILNAYRKEAKAEALYMPIYMDFRGRLYLRPNLVTYQGGDLQKALLVFPQESRYTRSDVPSSSQVRAVVYHMSNLYGNGLDKAPWGDRLKWYEDPITQRAIKRACEGLWDTPCLVALLSEADEPLQLLTALLCHKPGRLDTMACQIDGTCNGLQHLSALFRDETAAPFVNLTSSSVNEPPCDIYGEIAERTLARLREIAGQVRDGGDGGPGGGVAGDGGDWARRLLAAVKVDRKLCKKPVMVLPYGGTRGTIEDAVLGAILGQEPAPGWWIAGVGDRGPFGLADRFPDWVEGNYAAHSHKELADHPLLHLDAKRLAGLIWDTITEMLPKAMAAMQTFRDIAKYVGDRTLEWDTGFSISGTRSETRPDPSHPGGMIGRFSHVSYDSLWVTQAKAKSERSTVKFQGYHLPGAVRGLSIRAGRDEIDAASHTTGIVANFIHSQDAAHLAATLYIANSRSVGTIHDCFLGRPSEMTLLGNSVRHAFKLRYGAGDPLALPVHVHARGRTKRTTESFASWYELAAAAGTAFPEDGTWEPSEVCGSAWLFS